MALKIKKGTQITFEAKDDAEALRSVRDRLGPDAVILSSRPIKRGGFLGFFRSTVLQVNAAILEEEDHSESDRGKKERLAAFQKLLEIKQALASDKDEGVTDGEASALDLGFGKGENSLASAGVYSPRAKNPTKGPSAPRAASVEDGLNLSPQGLALASERKEKAPQKEMEAPAEKERVLPSGKLQDEVNEIARRLDQVLKRLETERSEPVASPATEEERDILSELLAADVSETHGWFLVERFRADGVEQSFSRWLGEKIPVASKESWDALGGRKVMLIGPTGVGKTTTIAKLAAIHSLWEKKKVFLLTADTYRIAAVKQIETYSKILGIPMGVVDDPARISPVLEKTQEADLILLDTAGRSQRDGARIEEMRELYEAFSPDIVHLVLSSNMKYRDMLDVVKRMGVVPINRFIFTKTDETTTYGALLNILFDFDRPASFITTGQNVPNDIEVASGARLAGMLLGKDGGARSA